MCGIISPERPVILLADDDEDDCLIIRDALRAANVDADLETVHNGEQLLEHLRQPGTRRPWLILLDLNMPLMDGREALRQIKSDPTLRRLVVLVFTTSNNTLDVEETYRLGCNAYLKKPARYSELIKVMRSIGQAWLSRVELPLPV